MSSSILLVIEGTFPWYRGGVSEWIAQYLNAFQDLDFSVLQIATDRYRNAELNEALYNIPDNVTHFERVQPPVINENWEKDSENWVDAVRTGISEIVKSCRCVHTVNTGFAGWLGMKIAAENGVPLLLTEHALYWKEVDMGAVALECGYQIPRAKREKLYVVDLFRDIAQNVYRSADMVISVSNCNIENQKAMGAENVKYIPNGVDTSWIIEQKERSGNFTLGWIGRCAEMKNPLTFLNIAEALNGRADCLMMACDAGEQNLKNEVCRKAGEISNLELIWNRPAIEHIDEMDALCITSHNESQPLVLFEALSRKVLPVGWKVGDVTSEHAYVVDDNYTAQMLADKVLELWKDRDKWDRELEKRFSRLKTNHTWDAIFQRYRNELEPYWPE